MKFDKHLKYELYTKEERDFWRKLESIYLSKLRESDLGNVKLSKEAQEVRKIMEDWTGED